MPQLLRDILEDYSAKGVRSSALQPIFWMLGLLLGGIVATVKFGGPHWLLVTLTILLIILLGISLFAFLYLLFKDRDALRSERFALQKLAIEKMSFGDSKQGVFDPTDLRNIKRRSVEQDRLEDQL